MLGASQRLPHRAHVHTSRFSAPCTAYFVFCTARSTQLTLINPYCDQIVPRPRGTLSSPRVPMPSSNKPDEGLGLGQGLLLGFNSLASPLPCQVSQSVGEHSGPASEPCPAHPHATPTRPNVVTIPESVVPNTGNTRTRQETRARQDKTRQGPSHFACTPGRPPTCQLAPCSRLHLHLMSRRGGTTSSWGQLGLIKRNSSPKVADP